MTAHAPHDGGSRADAPLISLQAEPTYEPDPVPMRDDCTVPPGHTWHGPEGEETLIIQNEFGYPDFAVQPDEPADPRPILLAVGISLVSSGLLGFGVFIGWMIWGQG